MSKRHKELAEANLRSSGSSSAWCSAHVVSAAAGRMFEDPGLLRFGSARHPWSLEQQSSGPVYACTVFAEKPSQRNLAAQIAVFFRFLFFG
ncbi:MAG: hypothetical protein IPK68_00455 [Bdellovibrionales bacterium]|nr:hypothetical protein [Bdellovibrionales bacterium]